MYHSNLVWIIFIIRQEKRACHYKQALPLMVSWAVLWSADSRDRQASFSLCLLLGGHPALVSHAGRAYVPASSPKTNKRMLLPVCHPGPPAPLASPGTGKNSTFKNTYMASQIFYKNHTSIFRFCEAFIVSHDIVYP